MLFKLQVHVPDAEGGPSKLNLKVWNRERLIKDSYKELGGSCPKTPELVKVFSKCMKNQMLERVVVSFCRLLGVIPFVLRLGHGQVMMFL